MNRNLPVRVAEFLALKRNPSLLLGALVLGLTGERLWLGFAPKYLESLGGGVLVIGLFDALQTLLGALYAYPGGWLTERWGQRRSLLFFNALTLAGYALVLAWSHWLALLVGSFLFLAWSGMSLPATLTVVATSLEARRHTMGVGVQSMVRRVPMMLGPLAGGWLIQRFGWGPGTRVALAVCVVLALLTTLVQWLMEEPPPPGQSGTVPKAAGESPGPTAAIGFLAVVRSFSPTLRELLCSDILVRFCERIPFAFVILWATEQGGLDARHYSYLVAVEMVIAMLCYIPVAHLADKHGRRPFVLATFVFFTLFPLTLIRARSFAWLVAAFAVRGLKEFGEPARKALIIGSAAPELRSRTFGAYYLIRDCLVTSGSFLGAWLWSLSPVANFIGAAVCGTLGTLWFWWFVYRRETAAERSDATEGRRAEGQAEGPQR
jgi:MFS family permease